APGPPYDGTGAAEGASPIRVEPGRGTALVSGLVACTPYYISLTAVDRFGNESAPSPEIIGIPFTGTPCERATLDIQSASGAGCSQEVPIRIDDANASANPSQPGTISVTATSGTDPSPLLLTLPETGPGTGTYTGTIPLSPVQAAGRLHVTEGDRLAVTYVDQDAGGGAAAPIAATLPVDDCTPPAISGFRFTGLGFDSVRLEFTTSEPATSLVRYGLDSGLSESVTDTSLATSHALTLTALPACSNIFYRVLASDNRGNTTVLDDGGSPLHFGSARELEEFQDDMESGAPGWTSSGTHNEWELGVPAVGPPPHATGATVWGTDLDGRYDQGADAMLTTPEIDLVGLESAYLTFSHWYDIYTSTPGAGFDDGGWVEVSRNGGATWTYVTPDGGYPDRMASSPYLVFGTPGYAGKTADWETARFNLDAFAGSKIRIRFHLYQDNFDPPHPGLGWYIDDVAVYSAAPCHAGRVHISAGGGNCGDSPMRILVWDSDGDVDPLSPDTIHVRLASTSDPAGLDIPLG
ncbi:MAG TPA: hypothetical protein VNI57_14415, partial [Candidatus Saccharimonadales bacterium]|nr:hypothetical protein [Candidatus Saccharimonadales bacterium]